MRYSIMTMSIPAQTTPDEIRLVAQAPAVAAPDPADEDTAAAQDSAVSQDSSIRVSGAANEIAIGGIKNGQILLENDEEGAAYPRSF